jgi:hypothetical protein
MLYQPHYSLYLKVLQSGKKPLKNNRNAFCLYFLRYGASRMVGSHLCSVVTPVPEYQTKQLHCLMSLKLFYSYFFAHFHHTNCILLPESSYHNPDDFPTGSLFKQLDTYTKHYYTNTFAALINRLASVCILHDVY